MVQNDKSEPAPKPQVEKSGGIDVGSVTDLGVGLFDGAVAKPYNATLGHVLPKIDLTNSYDHNSIAAKIGDFGGTVFDVAVLSKLTGSAVGKSLDWGASKGLISASMAESPLLASTLSLGTTGALYGGVFTEGDAATRAKNATIGLATFGTMGFAGTALGSVGWLGQAGSRTLLQDMTLGGLTGVPGGIANAEATSLVNGNGFTLDPGTLVPAAAYYGLFGAAMSGTTNRLDALVKARSYLTQGAPANDSLAEARLLSDEAVPAKDAGTIKQPFDIPKTGNIELGKMMRELGPEDQIRLVQEVVASRPQVPVGSWMRLIAPEDMAQFLRATDQMFPDTALNTAGYLIDTRNLRPPTSDSPPIDFTAWERALHTVRTEKG